MVKPKHLPDSNSVVRLWCHESARVFRYNLYSLSSNLRLFLNLNKYTVTVLSVTKTVSGLTPLYFNSSTGHLG